MENPAVWIGILAVIFALGLWQIYCNTKVTHEDSPPIPTGTKFFLWINEKAEGPFTAGDVMAKLRCGSATMRTLCTWDGGEWRELDGVSWRIKNTAAAEAMPPVVPAKAAAPVVANEYFITLDGAVQGPFTLGQMQSMWSAGRLNLRTQFMKGEAGAWEAMSVLVPLLEPAIPVRGERTTDDVQVVATRKSRGMFMVLGLIFGSIGLHNFYAGFVGKGIVQFAVSLLLCWTLLIPVLIWLWAVLEVISTEKDAQGIKMV